MLLGLPEQADVNAHVVRESKVGHRITDLAGRTAWADVPDLPQGADLAICKDPGIGRPAAALGTRSLDFADRLLRLPVVELPTR